MATENVYNFEEMVRSEDETVRETAVGSFGFPHELAEQLYPSETSPRVRAAMLSRVRNPALLREGAVTGTEKEAASVAGNRHSPGDAVDLTVERFPESFSVLVGAASNPNCPHSLLSVLLRSSDPMIQTSALRNPGMTLDILRAFTAEILMKINSGEFHKDVIREHTSRAGSTMSEKRMRQNKLNARNAGRKMDPFRAELKEAGIRWYMTKQDKIRFYRKLPEGRKIELIAEHESWQNAERDPLIRKKLATSTNN